MQLPNYPRLIDLRRELGLRNFVETGCYRGNGIKWALDAGFESVYSCDVIPKYVKVCRQRFVGRPVMLQCSESVTFLRDLIPQLQGPTLFWLDAHFPSYYHRILQQAEHPWEREYPLYDECLLIMTLKPDHAGDLIVCDDVDSVPGFPGILRHDRLPYSASYSYAEFVELFAATHVPTVPFQDEAVVTFMPKGSL